MEYIFMLTKRKCNITMGLINVLTTLRLYMHAKAGAGSLCKRRRGVSWTHIAYASIDPACL